MATDLTRDDIRKLARLGAARRLEELKEEEAAIRAAFPDLKAPAAGRGARRGRPGRPAVPTGATASGAAKSRKRKRRKMSPAEKRAVSERMRKYWAERRKRKGKG